MSFTTVSLNPQIYLPWLYHGLRARGVNFVRKKVESIAEAAEYFNGSGKGVVVNATALGQSHNSTEIIRLYTQDGAIPLNVRETL